MRRESERSLFEQMVATGDRLIEAQRAEEKASRLFDRQRTEQRMLELRAARHRVEELAEQYLAAIRKWRTTLEAETAERFCGSIH